MSEMELREAGLAYLIREFGEEDALLFVSSIAKQALDYTAWQREYYDKMTPEEYDRKMREHALAHPFKPLNAVPLETIL